MCAGMLGVEVGYVKKCFVIDGANVGVSLTRCNAYFKNGKKISTIF
jgi:hypothetical protein